MGEEISLFWRYRIKESDLALAVTSDGNIDQLGDGDNGNLGVQDDAEIVVYYKSYTNFHFRLKINPEVLLTQRPC